MGSQVFGQALMDSCEVGWGGLKGAGGRGVGGGCGGREEGRTNERTGTDHVTRANERPKKTAPNGADIQTDRQMDMATL